MSNGIVRATRDDIGPLSLMLSRAFAHEPFHQWLFAAESSSAERSRRLFRCELRNMLRDGVVLTTRARDAAALWGTPDKPEGSWLSQLVITMTLWRLLGRRTRSVLRELEAVARLRPARPHWYLSVIATAPGRRGQGLGGALMRRALSVCDSRREGAWLEVASPALVRFYGRYGFAEQGCLRLPEGPEITGMWRAPGESQQLA